MQFGTSTFLAISLSVLSMSELLLLAVSYRATVRAEDVRSSD